MKTATVASLALISFAFILSKVEGELCDVVPIEEWSGSSSGWVTELTTPVDLVVITHTVTAECTTDTSCENISNAIRNYHMQQGFSDIRLSFLVGGNGKIYEGAGWKVGSHSTGYNDRSVSLSFIGNFTDTLPNTAALKAAERFFGCYLNNAYFCCEYSIVGHRQIINTSSPGAALQSLIETWPHWTSDISNL